MNAVTEDTVKYFLSDDKIPAHWYNIQADLFTPLLSTINCQLLPNF